MGEFFTSDSKTYNTSYATDKKITSQGAVTNLADSKLTATGEGRITINDPELARISVQAAQALGGQTLTTAAGLAAGANNIAAQVADSQRSFVETASGQKSAIWIVGLIAAAVALFFLTRRT